MERIYLSLIKQVDKYSLRRCKGFWKICRLKSGVIQNKILKFIEICIRTYDKEMKVMYNYINNYKGRTDLTDLYGNNALLLYALQLRYDIEDIIAVASEALTDGSDDKKCDLIYIDQDAGFAVIAQAYMKQSPEESDLAKVNKASDLNVAASWIFTRNIEDIPARIKDSVSELQDAIKEGDINTIYFWYVHNLNEKNNPEVQEELNTVQIAAQQLVNNVVGDNSVKIVALEVGNNTIERWYNSSNKRITIEDAIEVKGTGKAFEINGNKWKACVTAVKGSWVRHLYLTYKDDLFSGNPRNFLGAGKRKNKINLGIMKTVEKQPENFWAYNNGLTALVNGYDIDDDVLKTVRGITIINGAQSTGAIGAVENFRDDFLIPIRFIVCSDPKIIEEIINNNNKQNEILPSDLRSNDKQQVRLRREFKKYPQLYYSGGRRDSTSVRNKEVFDPYLVAQTLVAFHGDCVTAYNSKKAIWDEDKEYTNVFSDQLTVEHIIFVYSLGRAIDEYKLNLKGKKEQRTDVEEEELTFLSKRGSKMLLIQAISNCMESLLGEKILDLWRLIYKDNQDFDKLVERWNNIIDILIPFHDILEPALQGGLKNRDTVRNVCKQLRAVVASLSRVYISQLKEYAETIKTEM